jgi:hypothetical protein
MMLQGFRMQLQFKGGYICYFTIFLELEESNKTIDDCGEDHVSV